MQMKKGGYRKKVSAVSELIAALLLIMIMVTGFALVSATIAPRFAGQQESVIAQIHKDQIALDQLGNIFYTVELSNDTIWSYIYNYGTVPITPEYIFVNGTLYYSSQNHSSVLPLQGASWSVSVWETNNKGGPGQNIPYSTTPTTYGTVVEHGTFPSFYFSYGTQGYQGKTVLGMVTSAFPQSTNDLNTVPTQYIIGFTAYTTINVTTANTYYFKVQPDGYTEVYLNGPTTNGWQPVYNGKAWQNEPGNQPIIQSVFLSTGIYNVSIMWANPAGQSLASFLITNSYGSNTPANGIEANSFPLLTFLNGTPANNIPPQTIVRINIYAPQGSYTIYMITTAGQEYKWTVSPFSS